MHTTTLLLLCVFAFVSTLADEVPLGSKTQYYTNGLDFDLNDIIESVPHTYTQTSSTDACSLNGACTTSATAYIVAYQDQGSVPICICDNAVFDIVYAADQVGKIPYPIRQKVLAYIVASEGKGGGAYSTGNQVYFFDEGQKTEVFIHESAHAFDGAQRSPSQDFHTAISADSCVPDAYSASSDAEDFAQLMVTYVYYTATSKSTPACLSNAINYLSSILPASDILSTITLTNAYKSTTSSLASSGISSTSSSGTSSTTSAVSSRPCSVSIRQTLTNSWTSDGASYTQYDVTYTNNGASATDVVVGLRGGQITQVWVVSQGKDGLYHLPYYMTSLAAGQSLTWGYVTQSSPAATITLVTPSCSASASGAAATSSASGSATSSTSSVSSPSSTTSTTGASGSCAATLAQSVVSAWANGGQTSITITNSGTKAITALQFALGNAASGSNVANIWNVQQTKNGEYAVDSFVFPLAVGASSNAVGYTYAGSATLTASLAAVSC